MKSIPEYRPLLPHWVGGLVQTIAANLCASGALLPEAEVMHLLLPDGDSVAVLKNIPAFATGKAVLVIHGLGASAHDPVVQRATLHLLASGNIVYRMNHRGVAEGSGKAKGLYHAGRESDVACVVETLSVRESFDALAIVAYSLSGNMALHYLGKQASKLPPKLRGAVCLCPVIDIARASKAISHEHAGVLNRFFMKAVREYLAEFPVQSQVAKSYRALPSLRRLCDLEDLLVAPLGGYGTALEYYRQASALPYISRVTLPTYVVNTQDDPIAVTERTLSWSNPNISLLRPVTGGHLGFLAKGKNSLGTRFWIDELTQVLVERLWGMA